MTKALSILILLTTIAPLFAAPAAGNYARFFAGRWVGGSHGNIVYKIYALSLIHI